MKKLMVPALMTLAILPCGIVETAEKKEDPKVALDQNDIDPHTGNSSLMNLLLEAQGYRSDGFAPYLKKMNEYAQHAKRLVDAKANVSLQNKEGQTPLIIAADAPPALYYFSMHSMVIKLLLGAGADCTVQDKTGNYPVSYLRKRYRKLQADKELAAQGGYPLFMYNAIDEHMDRAIGYLSNSHVDRAIGHVDEDAHIPKTRSAHDAQQQRRAKRAKIDSGSIGLDPRSSRG